MFNVLLVTQLPNYHELPNNSGFLFVVILLETIHISSSYSSDPTGLLSEHAAFVVPSGKQPPRGSAEDAEDSRTRSGTVV